MFCRVIFNVVVAVSVLCAAGALRAEDDSLEVHADNVSTLGLLMIAADLTHYGVAIGPGLSDTQVSIDKQFASPELFFSHVASLVHGEVKQHTVREGPLVIIRHPCLVRPTRLLSDDVDDTRQSTQSFLFEQLSLSTLIQLGAYAWNETWISENADPLLPRFMGVHARLKKSEFWNLVATSSGLNAERTARGVIFRADPALMEECSAQFSAQQAERRNTPMPCRGDAASGRRDDLCDSLERYARETLTMRGYVVYHRGVKALVEAPDTRLYATSVGQYVGYNFGKVESVTEQGLGLTELILSGKGWLEQRVQIPYKHKASSN